jgi:hypothetical protein
MLTTEQVRNKTKTVTRRNGWWFLKPGDILNAVEKAMGLKKGEKIKHICQVIVKSTRAEALNVITDDELVLEGFPDMSRDEFIAMYCRHNRCPEDEIVNRIEFGYI